MPFRITSVGLRGPRLILWGALLIGAGVLGASFLYPNLVMREVVAVENVALEDPRTINVRVLHDHKVRRLWIHSGECRTHADDGSRGPFDVQSVILRGNKIWLCPDPDVKRPTEERCEWRQRVELECLLPPVVSAKKIPPRRFGRILKMRIRDKAIRIVTEVDLEQYVEDVVMTEHPTAPFETRRVQAIVARTFAVHAIDDPRHEDAPVCDTQHCQAFASSVEPKPDELAALTTKNVVMVDSKRRLAPTYFHSTCGGRTRNAADVWPGGIVKDIVAALDVDENGRAWCRHSPHHRWKLNLPEEQVAKALSKAVGRRLDPRTLEIRADRDGVELTVKDKRGKSTVLASAIHRELGRELGFTKFKSSDFQVTKKRRRFYFSGRGLGHGVGLCQYGAEARAKAGQSAEQILEGYFPKLELAHLAEIRPQR
jgi:stage II sporulation protein D